MKSLSPYNHIPSGISTDSAFDLSRNLWFKLEYKFSLNKSSELFCDEFGDEYCIVDCTKCYSLQGEYGFLKDLIGTIVNTKHVESSSVGVELKKIWNDINVSDANEWNVKAGIYRFYEELVRLSFKIVLFIPDFQLIIDNVKENELHILNNISIVNEYVKIWIISDNSFVKNGSLLRTNFCKSFSLAGDKHVGKIDSIITRNFGIEKKPELVQKSKYKMERIKLFISYAHADEKYKDELKKHLSGLKRNGIIKEWNDRYILPGKKWDDEIKRNLEESQIVLFLISSDFMSSDYINDVEIAKTLNRYEKGEVVIIPIIIRSCDFSSLSLSDFQALPKDAKAVKKWKDKDEAWLSVINGIKEVIASFEGIALSNSRANQSKTIEKSIINQSGDSSINIGNNSGTINISK